MLEVRVSVAVRIGIVIGGVSGIEAVRLLPCSWNAVVINVPVIRPTHVGITVPPAYFVLRIDQFAFALSDILDDHTELDFNEWMKMRRCAQEDQR